MPRASKGTSPTTDIPESPEQPGRSQEWMVVLAITLAGIALRVWQPSHMAVEHFDEGVYASNILCPFNGDRYPFRHLYAPPLLPFLLEWTLILTGMNAASVIWVNVVAGCVMVPSIWWVSRQWFGPIAGMTSATLAAFSEVHILFSRTALTDVLLCLWMLWAVYWAWRAILTGRPLAIFLAGLFASLAWWTKYNGWLTLAISGSGTLAWLIVPRITPSRFAAHFQCAAKREDVPSPGAVLLRWSLLATIAIVGWLPVLIDLQQYGGYAAVSANHAGYFVGFGGWWESFSKQLTHLRLISQSWTWVGVGLCPLIVVHPGSETLTRPLARFLLAFGLLIFIELADYGLVDSAITIGILTVCGVVATLTQSRNLQMDLAGWFLCAWFIGLFTAVPLYTPYLRLTVPLIVTCWLLVGRLFESVNQSLSRDLSSAAEAQRSETHLNLVTNWLLIAPIIGLILIVSRANTQVWQDRGRLQEIAFEISEIQADWSPDSSIGVIGEPGLFYQLGFQSGPHYTAAFPVPDFGIVNDVTETEPTVFLVTGPHSPLLSEQPQEVQDRLSLVAEWPYQPSLLVQLDERASSNVRQETVPIRLYRVRP
ncbi:MAG: glycosyltransferase family 39 protein [Planctomycetaceae bacterium]|nr:glycosyltransferase family 39 protein [Planctomycetaceae bacterium]